MSLFRASVGKKRLICFAYATKNTSDNVTRTTLIKNIFMEFRWALPGTKFYHLLECDAFYAVEHNKKKSNLIIGEHCLSNKLETSAF